MQEIIYAPVGWALRKDSELEDLFDYHLLRMIEVGIVKPVGKLNMKTYNEDYHKIKELIVLGFADLAFPFMLLIAGSIIALAQLGIEAFKNQTADKRSIWAVRLRSRERNPE